MRSPPEVFINLFVLVEASTEKSICKVSQIYSPKVAFDSTKNKSSSGMRQLLIEDNGRWPFNVVDWLSLESDTIGFWISGLEVQRSRTRPMVLCVSPLNRH